MKYFILLCSLLTVIFLLSCENKLDELRRENANLKKQLVQLKKENNELKFKLKQIEKIYNIDTSKITPKRNKSSGEIFRQVFEQ